ncbi:MAG: tRNA pseudouridine(38-40) synthase TruA [Halanaerobium sp.]|nr:tRNA pseudouridine(38-40) synthase TruA [Halanaerobium sp.]
MRNIKCLVEYDGTNYSGWQRQANTSMTIQQKLEEALKGLTGEDTTIYGAGRTDAGVHALGQVFNFFTDSSIPTDRFPYAFNTFLPADIVVRGAREVDAGFNSRHASCGKIYRYQIYNGIFARAIERQYYYHYSARLELARMKEAAGHMTGRQDFSAFRSAGCGAKDPVKEIYSIQIKEENEDEIIIIFSGSGFLYHMVRIMVGTLLQVGRGRIKPEEVKEILASKDRRKAGPTVPPEGLILQEVKYGGC